MSAPAAGIVGAVFGATLGVLVGALLAAARVAELGERIAWMQRVIDEYAERERDEIVAAFREQIDDWDEG